jgi:hypothetical protein
MDRHSAQVQARLKWEIAHERLTAALKPVAERPAGQGVPELKEALKVVHAAIDAINAAFGEDAA